MSQLETIKQQFHSLIDQVDDEGILARHLGGISVEVKGESTDFWDDLTSEEQADILEAIDQTEDSSKLISNEDMKRKYKKWLTAV